MKISHYLIVFILTLQLLACSDAGSQAGKADTTPPQIVLTSIPLNGSVSGDISLIWSIKDANPLAVEIWLSKDGGDNFSLQLATIPHDTDRSGSFTWNTDSPSTPDGGGYQLKLIAFDIPNNQSEILSPVFSINNSGGGGAGSTTTVFLTAPSGISTVHAATKITWDSNNLNLGKVDIDLSNDGGRSYPISIAAGINNNGSYTWNSSSYTGKQFRFSILVTRNGISSTPDRSMVDIQIDNTAPSVVDPVLHFTDPATDGITLNWLAANDSISVQNNLQYRVYYSDTNNISTLSLIDANASTVSSSSSNATTFTVTGISNAVNKFWNVVVEDEVGLRTAYAANRPTGIPVLSFGNNGNIVFDHPELSRNDMGEAVVIDSNGKLVVVGHSTISFDSYLMIWRYDKQGNPDVTFGDAVPNSSDKTGALTVKNQLVDGIDFVGKAIAIDAAGRIVVSGYGLFSDGTRNTRDILVWRFDANGLPDPIFGTAGLVRFINPGNDYAWSVAIGTANSIIVSGELSVSSGFRDMVLLRYDAFGKLDQNFGINGTGVVTHNSAAGGNDLDSGEAVAIDANKNIVVTGFSITPSSSPTLSRRDMVVWRFDSNGNPDPNFGNNPNDIGVVVQHNAAGGNNNDYGVRLVIDNSDRIVVVGYSVAALIDPDFTTNPQDLYTFDYDMAIWRLTRSGELDTTFNGTGIVTRGLNEPLVKGQNTYDEAWSVAIDNNNNLVVVGRSDIEGVAATAIWRYRDNGDADSSFGDNGVTLQRDPNSSGMNIFNLGLGLTIDRLDNSIFTTGYTRIPFGDRDMTLMRYQ